MADSTAKDESSVSTEPPGKTPRQPIDFTPQAFVAALEKSLEKHFEGARQDVAAQISSMKNSLDEHAAKELTQLELISFNLAAIQRDVDGLVQNAKNVNVRLTDHDDRISKLENELAELKKRTDQLQRDILELKAGT